jgi:hypothetical protein
MIRVILAVHLRTLAYLDAKVKRCLQKKHDGGVPDERLVHVTLPLHAANDGGRGSSSQNQRPARWVFLFQRHLDQGNQVEARPVRFTEEGHTLPFRLWEATDSIASKRIQAILRSLVTALKQHGHLALDSTVRQHLLSGSAATTVTTRSSASLRPW